MTEPELNDTVIRHLYEAASGLLPWTQALDGLYHELGARHVQLLTVDKTTGALLRSDQAASIDSHLRDAILEYVREYHHLDPHIQYTGSQPLSSVVNTADAFPIELYRNNRFYRDYWLAYGVREMLSAKIAEDKRFVVMLGLARTHDLPQYTDGDMRLLERYVIHLSAAYRIVRHLSTVQATAQAGLALIEASTRPIILLGSNQKILTVNPLARRILALRSVLYDDAGKLRCRSTQGTAELLRGLEEVGMNAVHSDFAVPRRRAALRLEAPSPDKETLLCSLWLMRPVATMSAFGPISTALLTIASSRSKGSVDPMFVSSMFDLTPAEGKIAVGLVEGKGLREISETQHVSLETIRAQLKSIFVKTDTHRQSELISLLLRVCAG